MRSGNPMKGNLSSSTTRGTPLRAKTTLNILCRLVQAEHRSSLRIVGEKHMYKNRMHFVRMVVTAMLLIGAAPQIARAQAAYKITDLGASEPAALNNAGQVTGQAVFSGKAHGFLYAHGGF